LNDLKKTNAMPRKSPKKKRNKAERKADANMRYKLSQDPSMKMFSAGKPEAPTHKNKVQVSKPNAKPITSAFESNRKKH
jgi:hypothetical protein